MGHYLDKTRKIRRRYINTLLQDTNNQLSHRFAQTITIPNFLIFSYSKINSASTWNKKACLEIIATPFTESPITIQSIDQLKQSKSSFIKSIEQIYQFATNENVNISNDVISCVFQSMILLVSRSSSIHDLVKIGYCYTLICTIIFQNCDGIVFPPNYKKLYFREDICCNQLIQLFDCNEIEEFGKKIEQIIDIEKSSHWISPVLNLQLLNNESCFLLPIFNNDFTIENFITSIEYGVHLIHISSHKFFCDINGQCLSIHDAFMLDLYHAKLILESIPQQDLATVSRIFECLNEVYDEFIIGNFEFSIEDIKLVIFTLFHERPNSLSYFFGEHELNHKNIEIFFHTKFEKLGLSHIQAFVFLGDFIHYCKNMNFNIVNENLELVIKILKDFINSNSWHLHINKQALHLYSLKKLIIDSKYKELFKEIIIFKIEDLTLDELNDECIYCKYYNYLFIEKSAEKKINVDKLILFLETAREVPDLQQCLEFIDESHVIKEEILDLEESITR